jgi:hypothetical protein
MQRVNETFYSLLKEWMPEGVAVYPSIAEESARYPYCVFSMASFTTKRVKEGIVGYNFVYEVNVWGCTFNQVDRIATKVMSEAEAFEEVRFDDPPGRMTVMITDGVSDYTQGGFVQALKFSVKYDGGAT